MEAKIKTIIKKKAHSRRTDVLTINKTFSFARQSSNGCPARKADSLPRHWNNLAFISLNPPWSSNEKQALFSDPWDFCFDKQHKYSKHTWKHWVSILNRHESGSSRVFLSRGCDSSYGRL